MGLTYATIEISNQADEINQIRGILDVPEIRRWNGLCLVDTGAIRMAITRQMKAQSGLFSSMQSGIRMADGSHQELELVRGMKVRCGNRICYTDAYVLQDDNERLLGAIAMEGMDLIVIPGENRLEY